MSTRRFWEGQKAASTGEKFDFPADFDSVREGLGTFSGHLKAVTGRSGRARAELGSSIRQAWLADVLRRIADHPAARLYELLRGIGNCPAKEAAATPSDD
jgi:hypothetical protein